MKHLSPTARKRLEASPWVEKLTEKQVHFTAAFKIKALELSEQGHLAPEIFRIHGLDPNDFKEGYCGYLLKKWRIRKRSQGESSFLSESRGRKRLPDGANLDEYTVEELKVIISVQEEMITLLKKKKALAVKK